MSASITEIPIKYNEKGLPIPRGQLVATEYGTLIEHYPEYLAKLIMDTGGIRGPIGVQYVVNESIRYAQKINEINVSIKNGQLRDQLHELEFEETPGFVHNYKGGIKSDGTYRWGRGLATITAYCAADCVHCTRGRIVGRAKNKYVQQNIDSPQGLDNKMELTFPEVDDIFNLYRIDPWLTEIIISGGEFLIARLELFKHVVSGTAQLMRETKYNEYLGKEIPVLDIVRIGARLPVQNPQLVTDERIDILKQLINPNFMLHINHPAELTDDALEALNKLRSIPGANLYSQSVFLRGVNAVLKPGYEVEDQELEYEQREGPDGKVYSVPVKDHSIDEKATVQLLIDMFSVLKRKGNINPYYLFQNDKVHWAMPLTVPPPQAIEIWQQVAPNDMSGLVNSAQFVFDNGHGKVAAAKSQNIISDKQAGHFDYRGHFVPWGELIEGA